MRTASKTALNGRPWSRAEPSLPLDPTSPQIERDADAAMTIHEPGEYPGFIAETDRQAAHGEAAHLPQ